MKTTELDPLQHPLMGARVELLLTLLWRNGFVRASAVPALALMLASAVGRAPLRLLEGWQRRRRAAGLHGLRDPVVVIGHWRSGTTHLHNLLATNPSFGIISPLAAGMPDELLTLATWFRPWLERALPEDRHVDRVAVNPDSPQEDEIPLASVNPLSLFHAFYFPRRFRAQFDRGVFWDGVSDNERRKWADSHRNLIAKIALHQGKEQILLKNPVYTARLRELKSIWPDARFVFIHRDPFEVYASTVRYTRAMLRMLALQRWEHIDIEAFVLETYTRLHQSYLDQRRHLRTGQLVEIGFAELQSDPVAAVCKIHEDLGLDGWGATEPRLRAYVESIAGYQKNELSYPRADIDRVNHAWRDAIERWDYPIPPG
ncbi:MAG: sulfotransferase [Myxococcota bacterium]